MLLTLTLTLAATALPAPSEQPPNVLFVLLDDVGVDRVGYYDEVADPGDTPVIDAVCSLGATARNAYACQTCSPSRLSIMTLDYPHLFGFGQAVKNEATLPTPPVDGSYDHFPQLLPAEYRTAAIGKWHMSNTTNGGMTHPQAIGWDTHRGVDANLDDFFAYDYFVDGVLQGEVTDYATTRQVDDALDFINAEDGPWFCYLALSAPHKPFHVPPVHLNPSGVTLTSSDTDKYKAAMTAADLELGRLLAGIRPAFLPNTYVVIMGDNGTPNGVGAPTHEPGKASLYEGGVNVPLAIAGPSITPGTELDGLIQVCDVAATLVDLCGGTAPSDRGGLVMTGYLLGRRSTSPREATYLHRAKPIGLGPHNTYVKSARGERYKVLLNAVTDVAEVYDLVDDPEELVDISGALPIEAQQLLDFIDVVDP